MKKLIMAAGLIFSCLPFLAQQRNASISFDKEVYDFGKIQESQGAATCKFEFTNTGSQPLVISNVTTSCGCTSPGWTKEPVLPGAKGYVSATYSASGRPGHFEKEVTVFSNAGRNPVVLKITGDVILSMEQMYPVKMGPLRLRYIYVPVGNISKGGVKTFPVEVLNTSASPVKLSFKDVASWYTVASRPETLAANQSGEIDLTFDTRKNNNWGMIIERFRVLVDGVSVDNNLVTITGNLVEDFSKLTPMDLADAPVAAFDSLTFDFGKISSGARVSHDFHLKNNGKNDLMIRNVSASCGCTVVTPRDMVIKPGGSTVIQTVFDSSGKLGYQNKTISVITNDPKNSKIILWVKGEIINRN